MTPPLVSILIPAYNAERWIRATIESALAQTWPAKEIVVVDDGSADRTAEAVRSVGSPHVRLVTQTRRGPSAAQNEAYRHARGDYIQRLDADDLLGPEKIALQMARLAGEPGAIAAGQWARFHETPSEAQFAPSRVAEDAAPADWLIAECSGGEPMLQPGLWLVPRAIADRAGSWDERLTLNNDFEYFVRVLLTGDVVRYCPGAHLYYRSGNPSSLGSTRTAEGWASAYLSFDLGVRALLSRDGSPRARRACADLFQVLAFDAYLESGSVASAAERRAAELGGSPVRMGGGLLFHALERTLGWKRAKRVKRWAYRLGYERVAAARQARASAQRSAA